MLEIRLYSLHDDATNPTPHFKNEYKLFVAKKRSFLLATARQFFDDFRVNFYDEFTIFSAGVLNFQKGTWRNENE